MEVIFSNCKLASGDNIYMYVIYEETGVVFFLGGGDFIEGKCCPSKSRCTSFNLNAGM